MRQFIFDLDGTLTRKESIPMLAMHFNIEDDIEEITMQTVHGNIPYMESFIRRVFVLGTLPVDEVRAFLKTMPLHRKVCDFIKRYPENCAVATGNMNVWVDSLLTDIGCVTYSSQGLVENNAIAKITSILKKETIVQQYQAMGREVVFIGDGNNDVEAMRCADIAIACGITHPPAKSTLSVAHYLVYTEEALCRLLHQLL